MRGTSLIGSQPHNVLLAANVEAVMKGNPFSALNKVLGLAPATPTIYGVNRATDIGLQVNNQGSYGLTSGQPKYQRIIADGVLTAWTTTDYPALANLHDDGAALTAANKLRTVVVVNGNIFPRKQSTVALTGGDWRAVAGAPNSLQVQKAGTGALGAGTVIEVYMFEAADIITQGPLVAGTIAEVIAYDFMNASSACALFADRV
jgi:hypothetical protein